MKLRMHTKSKVKNNTEFDQTKRSIRLKKTKTIKKSRLYFDLLIQQSVLLIVGKIEFSIKFSKMSRMPKFNINIDGLSLLINRHFSTNFDTYIHRAEKAIKTGKSGKVFMYID